MNSLLRSLRDEISRTNGHSEGRVHGGVGGDINGINNGGVADAQIYEADKNLFPSLYLIP